MTFPPFTPLCVLKHLDMTTGYNYGINFEKRLPNRLLNALYRPLWLDVRICTARRTFLGNVESHQSFKFLCLHNKTKSKDREGGKRGY